MVSPRTNFVLLGKIAHTTNFLDQNVYLSRTHQKEGQVCCIFIGFFLIFFFLEILGIVHLDEEELALWLAGFAVNKCRNYHVTLGA